MVRIIADKRPTLFLDEIDTQLGGNKEYAEMIRGVLNEGFCMKGAFIKCIGEDFKPTYPSLLSQMHQWNWPATPYGRQPLHPPSK